METILEIILGAALGIAVFYILIEIIAEDTDLYERMKKRAKELEDE